MATSIAFLASKGGVGKTTTCIHCAVLAGDALLIDVDIQGSAASWWETRTGELPELATGAVSDLKAAIKATKRKWVLIDSAPHSLADAQTVASVVDFAVIPVRPGILDLRAIGKTVEITRAAKVAAVVVINAAPAGRGTAEAAVTIEARRALSAYGLPVAPVAITQRVDLSHALNGGQAVTEFAPSSKASDEMNRLWRWISGKANAARVDRDR